MKRRTPKDVDEYIGWFPTDVQAKLKKVRATIRAAAPGADETISYSIPTFVRNGCRIYFAAFKDHISVYPAPRGTAEFKDELSRYAGGKGTVQFPLNKPIPFELIARITKFRMAERPKISKAKKGSQS